MGRGAIRLHPKHGVNPTMAACIICGEGTGEIVLLGAAYKGEAPRYMIISPEPCEKCRKQYLEKGTLLYAIKEVSEFDRYNGIRRGTGEQEVHGIVVLADSAFERILGVPCPERKIGRVEPEIIDELVEANKAAKKGEGGEDGAD